ncbi:MAG TPA: (2Fe-2S)-binding protein [Pseudonocardiaceae bacterium]|nr:(2Fe-2S)-binding protein [Pseudonocardiaceae bacterium]
MSNLLPGGDPPRRADPLAVTAALRRAAQLGPFFVLNLPGTGPHCGATALADLYDPAGAVHLDELVDHHARRLRTAERRVAASLLFQGLAARLWSPVLGCAPAGLVPDLDPVYLRWWRASPLGLRTEQAAGWAPTGPAQHAELAVRTVVEANLRPLGRSLRRSMRITEGLLWGNAASALIGAARVADPSGNATRTLVMALLDRDPLRGTTAPVPVEGPLTVRRRSCCLYYRVPAGGLCGDCALTTIPVGSKRRPVRSDGATS